MKLISARELKECIYNKNALIVDIRDMRDYMQGHINGAIHMDQDEVKRRVKTFSKNRKYVFVCDRGNLSLKVATFVSNMGYDAYSLVGGYRAFKML